MFALYTQLSPQEQKKLYTMISFQVSTDNDFEQFVKDERFTSGFVCPHCGCVGLSTEQVCFPCAIDRTGHSYSKIASLGRIATKNLHAVFDGKICPESTLCTDKMNAYVRFAKSNDIQLIQLKSGKEKKGIYNKQKINNFHSKLKKFMGKFNGVSTKYLNNYLIWHTWFDMKCHTQLLKG